jgi:hypothetical protein
LQNVENGAIPSNVSRKMADFGFLHQKWCSYHAGKQAMIEQEKDICQQKASMSMRTLQ